MHGDEVCARLITAGCRSRVLMLTAAGIEEDLVDDLSRGADDYVANRSLSLCLSPDPGPQHR